jgi:hypothetical protein
MSNIDPSRINPQFPVKGQDNPSQGFRDNFQGTVEGLAAARDEITALQLNQVSKGISTGTRFENSVDFQNNLQGAELNNLQLNDVTYRVKGWGQVSSGTVTVNYPEGSVHYMELRPVSTATEISVDLRQFPTMQFSKLRLYINVNSTATTVRFNDVSSITNATRLVNFAGGVMRFENQGTFGVEITSLNRCNRADSQCCGYQRRFY